MKTKLLALILSGLVGLSLSVLAHDDHEGDNPGGDQGEHQCNDQDDNDHGGDIDGNETLEATIVLTATADAPAGAVGLAKLESDNQDGTVTAKLSIETQGLAAGDYTLSAVKKSDGSSVTLGQISIGTSEDDEDGDVEHNDEDGAEENCPDQGTNSPPSAVLESSSDVELPVGLDPTDISQIILSDANGTALLVGDLTTPGPTSVIKLKASIRVKDANGALAGRAVMQSITKKGKRKDRFTLVASNVPANTTLNVHLNGTKVGTVTSNKKGKVMVKKLPANLLTVRSVKLRDGQGNSAASANF